MKSTVIIIIMLILFLSISYFLYTKEQKKTSLKNQLAKESLIATSTNNEVFTIIAFGDSLTAGYGVPLEESYPSFLEKELQKRNKNIVVVNMGVSGETTTGGLDRVDFILSQKPSLILLGLGANDMLRSSSPIIAKENLRKMLQRITNGNVKVILLGMKSVASNGKTYNDEFDVIYTTLAKEFNVPLVPFFLEGVTRNPSLNTNDGIHPNKAGYEKIVKENILPIILPLVANYK